MALGFWEICRREGVTAFNGHALTMVLVGSLAAVLISSNATTAMRTFTVLRELLPGLGLFSRATARMEKMQRGS